MSVENQVVIFLSFVIAGMLGGICFDFFRALRKNFDTIDLVVYIEDFIFWFLLLLVTLVTAYIVSDGEIRVYMLFSMVLGGVIYFLIFSKIFYKVFSLFFRYIESIGRNFLKLFRRTNHETKTQNT